MIQCEKTESKLDFFYLYYYFKFESSIFLNNMINLIFYNTFIYCLYFIEIILIKQMLHLRECYKLFKQNKIKKNQFKAVFRKGRVLVGCSPPWKNFPVKNLKGGTKVKIYPPPSIFKKFKGKPQRGYQRKFWLESRKTSKRGPNRVHQGTSRQEGPNYENFKNSGKGGKLIGFNGQFLAKSP
jgi:hypothetical protein